MQPDQLALEAPVEWLGSADPRVGLHAGHPGRIQDPNPQDIFVEWAGLEYGMASRVSYGLNSLGIISDVEFARRSARVLRGEPPLLSPRPR
jgi:hypothetical protein